MDPFVLGMITGGGMFLIGVVVGTRVSGYMIKKLAEEAVREPAKLCGPLPQEPPPPGTEEDEPSTLPMPPGPDPKDPPKIPLEEINPPTEGSRRSNRRPPGGRDRTMWD